MSKHSTAPASRRRIPTGPRRTSAQPPGRGPSLARRTPKQPPRQRPTLPGRAAKATPRQRPSLPKRTGKKQPEGFLPGLNRARPKKSAAKGKSGVSGALTSALSSVTSSSKKGSRTPGKKPIGAGLLAGAGVGAAALLKRRRDRSDGQLEPVEPAAPPEPTPTVVDGAPEITGTPPASAGA